MPAEIQGSSITLDQEYVHWWPNCPCGERRRGVTPCTKDLFIAREGLAGAIKVPIEECPVHPAMTNLDYKVCAWGVGLLSTRWTDQVCHVTSGQVVSAYVIY